MVQRACAEQQQQHRLLHDPVVPAAWRDARGQPRACSLARSTQEAQYRHRVERLAPTSAAVGLAVIEAVTPHPGTLAMRAGPRAVQLGVRGDGDQVLREACDAPYNAVHRSVFVVRGSRQTHDTNGVPAYLACAPSRDEIGSVLTNAPNDRGTSDAHGSRIAADITLVIDRVPMGTRNTLPPRLNCCCVAAAPDNAVGRATSTAVVLPEVLRSAVERAWATEVSFVEGPQIYYPTGNLLRETHAARCLRPSNIRCSA